MMIIGISHIACYSYIQIAQSLRRFGISDTTQNLLVIKVGGEASEVQQDMINNVKGELVPLSELDQMHDIKSIQKVKKMRGKSSWHTTEGLMRLRFSIISWAIKKVIHNKCFHWSQVQWRSKDFRGFYM